MIMAVVRMVPSKAVFSIMTRQPAVPGGDAERRDHAEGGRFGRGGKAGVDRADHRQEDDQRRQQVGQGRDPRRARWSLVGRPPSSGRMMQKISTVRLNRPASISPGMTPAR